MIKKITIIILFISFFLFSKDYFIFDVNALTIVTTSKTIGPTITYTTEKIGDRASMEVTVSVEDSSGTGIKEFRDYNNKLIVGNTYNFVIKKRGNYIFTATDNNNNTSQIKIDDSWVNPYIPSYASRVDTGASYWTSSNLREWLNSDSESPNYTNIEYKTKDKGFLNEFTEKEKDAIAVTERRVSISQNTDALAKEGGGSDFGHLNYFDSNSYLSNMYIFLNYKAYGYKKDLDKVFLLTPYEGYWYIERRGNNHKKAVTDKVKEKHKLTNLYPYWWMQGNTTQYEIDYNYVSRNTNDLPLRVAGCNFTYGVVPAINIKPDYIFNDNRVAKNLNIGDKVVFGKYMDEPIKWEVINISDNDFPLLLCDNIIEMKVFDTPGDQARLYSDYINYQSYDVSLFNDIQYKSTNRHDDIMFPTVRIFNELELDLRQNSSFTLNLEIEDLESGIDYIILPNNSKLKLSESNVEYLKSLSYTFSSNGNYVFKVMDLAGNYNEYLIPINNINQSPEVNIMQSNKDWSSEGVIIDIDSSANVKFLSDEIKLYTGYQTSPYSFPNYSSYTGKKFTISGYVEIDNFKPEILDMNLKFGIGFYYNTKSKKNETYTLGGVWGTSKEISLNNVIENGKQYFEFTDVISSNYASNLKPRLWVTNFYGAKGDEITFRVTDLKYECLDTNDFAIKSIELPNGDIIESSSYSYKIEDDGIHNLTYKVLDNRGKTTEKTITAKVDKTAPLLNLIYNTAATKDNITVNINASDATSGVKRIKLPNGNYITTLNSTYTISGDGNYIFECEDVAGNITRKTVSITNIDKEKPVVTINDLRTDWTNKPIEIILNAND